MPVNQHMIDHINWSVFWYSKKKKRWVRKRFKDDLTGALKFFTTHVTTHTGITLHSDNKGFPPPRRITEHERETWVVVKRKGKRYKKRTTEIVNLMDEYNAKGIWWCPGCVQLRKFIFVETDKGPTMYCPVCGHNNWMFHVRRHNPKASVIEQGKRQRRTRGNRRSRRSR
jgi:rubrerythrin